jgi:hypothetical protein
LVACTNQDLDQLMPLKWKQAREAAAKRAAGNLFTSRSTRQAITLQPNFNGDFGTTDTFNRSH